MRAALQTSVRRRPGHICGSMEQHPQNGTDGRHAWAQASGFAVPGAHVLPFVGPHLCV